MAWNVLLDDTFVPAGGYISFWKVVPVWLLLLIWFRLLTWADKDAVDAHLPRIPLNSGMLAGLAAGFVIFLLLPNFFLAYFALLIVFGAETGLYLFLRNKVVGLKDLKDQWNAWLKSLTQRKKKQKATPDAISFTNKEGKPVAAPRKRPPTSPLTTRSRSRWATRCEKGPNRSTSLRRPAGCR